MSDTVFIKEDIMSALKLLSELNRATTSEVKFSSQGKLFKLKDNYLEDFIYMGLANKDMLLYPKECFKEIV